MALATRPIEPEPDAGSWGRWYELARALLGYEHEEAVEYANHRFVEDENRPSAQRANAARPAH
jgi:hypothetical protein